MYNPNIHNRKSIRLKGYDYSNSGMYYNTICCRNKIYRFGNIVNGKMFLNEFGEIAYDEWLKLPKRFNNIELDIFQIMPNHMHSILIINDNISENIAGVNTAPKNALNFNYWVGVNPARTPALTDANNKSIYLGDIIGAYKSLVSNKCLEIFKIRNEMMGKLWHRNYWEHIIRNEKSYNRIVEYIKNNPMNWSDDKFNSELISNFDLKNFKDDFNSETKNNN